MLTILAVCAIIFAILCFSEYAWRREWFKAEFGRKFVHITVGSFVAFWPWFLSWTEIAWLSVAFIIVVLLSRYLSIFKAIHSVQRPTWGEVYFAAAVGLLALMSPSEWVYMAALLHMSLADGFAAIIGIRFGKFNQYKIAGHTKSVIGTLTFFIVSLCVLTAYSTGSEAHMRLYMGLVTATGATLLENFSIRGLDNLSVPIWVAFCLSTFA